MTLYSITQRDSKIFIYLLLTLSAYACSGAPHKVDASNTENSAKNQALLKNELIRPGEYHFKSLKQLTFGGENAEAYFNASGTELIFQSTRDGFQCDQIYRMGNEGTDVRLVSTGLGRTTCGYLFPNMPKIIYSSSHATLKHCPEKPDYSRGYVWPLLADLDIYIADDDGSNPTALSPSPGYDAEGVISTQGDAILFTSTRSGDIDIWIMDPDGTNAKQLTHEVGYDGGAFFSYDGTKIVYRANHPKDPKALKDYQGLLADGFVRPSVMDLFVMNRDGSNKTNILSNGAANFAPYFHPDGKRIIFASNMDDPKGRNFDLYLINIDGSGLERVTYEQSFDAFPMFSYDGKQLIFSSNRGGEKEGDTNVFIAEWTDEKPALAELSTGADVRWKQAVTTLASTPFAGRGIGSDGIEKAARYLESELKKIGVEEGVPNFRQPFPITVSKGIKKKGFRIKKGTKQHVFKNVEFEVFPLSTDGKIDGEPVFVGFGESNSKHDNYKGIDVKDKIVFVLIDEKHHNKKNAVINAKHHGAKAVVLIETQSNPTHQKTKFKPTRSSVGIPTLVLYKKAAEKLLGEDFKSLILAAQKNKINQPTTALSRVMLEVELHREEIKVQNIVGKIPAAGKPRGSIVLGAHYDHLGFGGEGSLEPDKHAIHPGADDNASGVASVLELAASLYANKATLNYDIYIVFFTAEESGLLGSEHFISTPPFSENKPRFMMNFDMVGRLKKKNLFIGGTGTAHGLTDFLRRSEVGLDLNTHLTPDGFGPSDQSSFYARKIPVVYFFTGLHEDYHRPGDSAEKINVEGAIKITTLGLRLVNLLNTQEKITLAKVASSKGHKISSSVRKYGAYFGSVPAFGDSPDKGVKISGTRIDSPAEKAGVKSNDIIIKFGDYSVDSMQDYAYALRQYKAGAEVEVVVLRNGQKITLKAKLGKPSTSPRSPHK